VACRLHLLQPQIASVSLTQVTSLIQGYVIGRTLETTEAELIETVFPTRR
jgi:hypothetical protein